MGNTVGWEYKVVLRRLRLLVVVMNMRTTFGVRKINVLDIDVFASV